MASEEGLEEDDRTGNPQGSFRMRWRTLEGYFME